MPMPPCQLPKIAKRRPPTPTITKTSGMSANQSSHVGLRLMTDTDGCSGSYQHSVRVPGRNAPTIAALPAYPLDDPPMSLYRFPECSRPPPTYRYVTSMRYDVPSLLECELSLLVRISHVVRCHPRALTTSISAFPKKP